MQVEEFIRAISDSDFRKLVDDDHVDEFLAFIEQCDDQGRDRIIIRFILETPSAPYYVWAIYPLLLGGEDSIELFPPDFADLSTYLRMPTEVAGEPFFEIALR